MESNGVPRERMLAINFTDPLARTDDKVEQANRSSTEDQRRELGEAVKELKRRTGAPRIALVGNSRGGYSIRNYIKNGGGADVSHAVLCGVPNHGVYDWDDGLGGEFNGRGPFLRGLNEGESEVTPGTAFLTLRSDGIDKYRASRRALRRQAGHADRRDGGRAGAEGRDQSRARRGRSSRDRVSSARVSRDLQIHRRPRAVAHRDRAGSGSQTERARDGHAGRRVNQPSGVRRNGRNLSRLRRDRRTHRRSDPFVADRRRRPLGSGAGRADLVSRNRADIGRARRPRISIARRFRAPPTSCICAPRARSGRPMPARAPWS